MKKNSFKRILMTLLVIVFWMFGFVFSSVAATGELRIVTSFSSPGKFPSGLASDGINLWSTDASLGIIHKLDPINGSILSQFPSPVEGISRPSGLAWDGTNLWYVDDAWPVMYKLDPADGQVLQSFDYRDVDSGIHGINGLTWDGRNLLLCEQSIWRVYIINPSDGAKVGWISTTVPSPSDLAWDGNYLWVSSDATGRIYKLNLDAGSIVETFEAPGEGGPTALCWDNGYLWIGSSREGKIYKCAIDTTPEEGAEITFNMELNLDVIRESTELPISIRADNTEELTNLDVVVYVNDETHRAEPVFRDAEGLVRTLRVGSSPIIARLESIPRVWENNTIYLKVKEINGQAVDITHSQTLSIYHVTNADGRTFEVDVDGYNFRNPDLTWREWKILIKETWDHPIMTGFLTVQAWQGHCFGMAASSAYYFVDPSAAPGYESTSKLDSLDSRVAKNILRYHSDQLADPEGAVRVSNAQEAFEQIRKMLRDDNEPVVIRMQSGPAIKHAVVGYKLVHDVTNEKAYVFLYDNNGPGVSVRGQFDLREGAFSYTIPSGKITYDRIVDLVPPYPVPEVPAFGEFMASTARGLWSDAKSFLGLASPATMLVTDKQGRRVGFVDEETQVNEIPGADIVVIDDEPGHRFVGYYIPLNLKYTVTYEGQQGGTMDTQIIMPTSDSTTVSVIYEAVDVKPKVKATVQVEPGTVGSTMEIDTDGDGVIDETKAGTRIITGVEHVPTGGEIVPPRQDLNWMNFTSCANVRAIVDDGDYLWVGGIGLTRLNKRTGEMVSYNRANSGLPYNNINALAIDAQGNLWIGPVTGEENVFVGGGLVRFDGTNWTVYNTHNSRLPDNYVTALAIDAQENIWIGTDGGGLVKFDGTNWTVYNKSNSKISSNYVRSLAVDAQGNLWIGMDHRGLAKFDGENWTVYDTHNSRLPNNNVRALAIDAQGNIWAGTSGGGLAKFDGTKWTVYKSGLPDNYVCALAIDAQGNIWIGTLWGGLTKFDGTNWIVYDTDNSRLPNNYVTALAIDAQGNVWIGTWYGGSLAKFDGTNWTVYNPGLPHADVRALAIDAQGNMWVGMYRGGLAKFGGTNWTAYDINSGLPSRYVNALAIDPQGNVWIGTAHGLAKFDRVNWTVYDTDNSKLHNTYINALAIDLQGDIWIGTGFGGAGGDLAEFNGTEWHYFDIEELYFVVSFAIDTQSNIWIGTDRRGLWKFDGVNWTVYNTRNSELPGYDVRALAIDAQGNKWIGTDDGLAKFDGVNWTVHRTRNSGLPNNRINALAVDAQRNIWIGTDGGGLAKFDGENWAVYNTDNSGLPFNCVNALAIDTQSDVWIGTGGGLAVYYESRVTNSATLSIGHEPIELIEPGDRILITANVLGEREPIKIKVFHKNPTENNFREVDMENKGGGRWEASLPSEALKDNVGILYCMKS